MWRRLFNGTTAASAMLCLVSGALWARSLGNFEGVNLNYVRCPRQDELHSIHIGFSWYSNTHRLILSRRTFSPAHFRGKSGEWLKSLHLNYPTGLRLSFFGEYQSRFMNPRQPGFNVQHSQISSAQVIEDRWVFAVRPWLPTLLAALLPALWSFRRLRANSWRFGLRQALLAVSASAITLWLIMRLKG
jgi:hypothetical protein